VVVAATVAVGTPKPNAGGAVEIGCAVAVVDAAPKDNPRVYIRCNGIF
jgi:hypothetical protein